MPGRCDFVSTTVIGCPIRRTNLVDHPPTSRSQRVPSKDVAEPTAPRERVPWRTIWASIASVAVVYLSYQAFIATGRVITYLIVALFFAIVLTPPVDFLQNKFHIR